MPLVPLDSCAFMLWHFYRESTNSDNNVKSHKFLVGFCVFVVDSHLILFFSSGILGTYFDVLLFELNIPFFKHLYPSLMNKKDTQMFAKRRSISI